MTDAEVRLRRSIHRLFPGGPLGLELPLLSRVLDVHPAKVRLTSIRKREDNRDLADTVAIACSVGDRPGARRLVLGLPLCLARRVIDLALGRPPVASDAPISSGEQGALLYAIDRAGGDWIEAGGAPFTVRGFLADAADAGTYLESEELVEVGGLLGGGAVEGPFFIWISDREPLRPGGGEITAPDDRAGSWSVALRVIIGESRIPVEDVQNLAVGDVVVLDTLSHPQAATHARIRICSGKWFRTAVFDGADALGLVSDEKESVDMKHEDTDVIDATLKKSMGPEPGTMDLRVHVELGELTMSVSEAAGLMPGRVIQLDKEIDTEVVLRVGEKRIARGELVNTDGAMGVEIKEIL